MGRVGSLAAGTVLLGRVVVMRCLVLLALLGSGCNGQPPGCDTGPYYRCAGGVVYEGECGGQGSPAAQCAKGCAVEDSYESIAQCPFQLCLEDAPKKAGDPCQSADDCHPTQATWSGATLTNVDLTCDGTTQACVATASPTVADWMKPCSPDVVAEITAFATNGNVGGALPDPGCAEGWCAYNAGPGACIAAGCTRPCQGDQDCPSSSLCHGAVPTGCPNEWTPFCESSDIAFACP